MQSLIETLSERASLHPARVALVADQRRVSYGELWQRVEAVAGAWARRGVERGDRILLCAPSAPAFAYGYFASHLLGAVAIPLDPSAPASRRAEIVERAGPELAYGPAQERDARLGETRAIDELEHLHARAAEHEPPAPDALADLLFTTGTTGRPKGVEITHQNLAVTVRRINEVIGTREGDVELLPLPLHHSFGLGRLRCCLAAGATVVLVDGFRLPGEIFRALELHRASGLAAVPAGLAVLLGFGARGLAPFADRLRYVEIGSAPMPLAHKRSLMELLPRTELWMHYGLTEAPRSCFVELHRHGERLDSAGRATPGVELRALHEDGSACAPGEAGELWIGGAHVARGYWGDPELGARSFRDGFVRTGDRAHLDDAGFLHLHGRIDDMINSGGYKVSPDEVERVLCEHPSIAEAACVGIPDPRGIAGQVVRAHLVPAGGCARPADRELARWVAERLEPYKVPTDYRWERILPRTASGKLVRRNLRDACVGNLGGRPAGGECIG